MNLSPVTSPCHLVPCHLCHLMTSPYDMNLSPVILISDRLGSRGYSALINSDRTVPCHFLFIAVLILDLFQYVIQTAIWYPYYAKHKELHKNEKEDDVNLQEPEIYSAIPWCFWLFKLIMVVIAYFLMGIFLLR